MHDGVATPSPAPLLVIIAKLLRHDDDTPLHVHTRMGALRPALTAPYAAGGEPPLLKVQRGAAHPRTNSAARAAEGEPPLLKAPRTLRAPRKSRSSSGPGGHTPLSQPSKRGTALPVAACPTGWSQLLAPHMCQAHYRRVHTHSYTETPLGVPMWHTCSSFSCQLIFTMRQCAPSDSSEEGSGYESG